MSDAQRLAPIRRVITGHDRNNIAKVIIDGPATNAKQGASGATSTLIWSTDSTPADVSIGEDIEDLARASSAPRRPRTARALPSSSFRPAIRDACTAPRPSITSW